MNTPRRQNLLPKSFVSSYRGRHPETSARAEARSKEGHFYKPLDKQFSKDDFIYRQITREGNGAIYEQAWNGCSDPSICYEVVRIRRRDGFMIGTRWVEAAEVYPNSDSWGIDGFTLADRESAFRKLSVIAKTFGSEEGISVAQGANS